MTRRLGIRKSFLKPSPVKPERNDLDPTSGNSSGSYENESREIAAEKVNADVSGRTLEKGKKVKEKAESDDEPELAATNTHECGYSSRENDNAVAHGRGEPVWQKPLLPNRETPTNSPFEPLRDNYCYSRRV